MMLKENFDDGGLALFEVLEDLGQRVFWRKSVITAGAREQRIRDWLDDVGDWLGCEWWW